MKPRILVFADWYLPGNKGGGALSHVCNLIELLGDDYHIYVITRNRDNTDKQPYRNVASDQWVQVGKAQVLYVSRISFQNIRRRIWEVDPQIIYLNSFFSRFTVRTLILRRIGLLPRSTVVLTPQGEFSPGALAIKSFRKHLYVKLALDAGLYQEVLWQACNILEEGHIVSVLKKANNKHRVTIFIAPDVPSPIFAHSRPVLPCLQKSPGELRMVFLSRVSAKKNLLFALEVLNSVEGNVMLDIYGPVEDQSYWRKCQNAIQNLPENIKVCVKGPVSPSQVTEIFSQYHFQILPTHGENFGYVILEAFASGCPVLISDETPWRDLAFSGVGWDIPLADTRQWIDVLRRCIEMDQETYALMSQRSRSYFEQWMANSPYIANTQKLFQTALERHRNLGETPTLQSSVGPGD